MPLIQMAITPLVPAPQGRFPPSPPWSKNPQLFPPRGALPFRYFSFVLISSAQPASPVFFFFFFFRTFQKACSFPRHPEAELPPPPPVPNLGTVNLSTFEIPHPTGILPVFPCVSYAFLNPVCPFLAPGVFLFSISLLQGPVFTLVAPRLSPACPSPSSDPHVRFTFA